MWSPGPLWPAPAGGPFPKAACARQGGRGSKWDPRDGGRQRPGEIWPHRRPGVQVKRGPSSPGHLITLGLPHLKNQGRRAARGSKSRQPLPHTAHGGSSNPAGGPQDSGSCGPTAPRERPPGPSEPLCTRASMMHTHPCTHTRHTYTCMHTLCTRIRTCTRVCCGRALAQAPSGVVSSRVGGVAAGWVWDKTRQIPRGLPPRGPLLGLVSVQWKRYRVYTATSGLPSSRPGRQE